MLATGLNDAGRGFNIVVVDPKKKDVIRVGHFDTYSEGQFIVKWGYFAYVGLLCGVVKMVLFWDAKPQEYSFHLRKVLSMKC